MNNKQLKNFVTELNDFIREEVQKNDHYRNFIYFITNNFPGSISIKGNFIKNDNYEYFGVSPKYSVNEVKKLIIGKKSCFNNKSEFIKYLKGETTKFWNSVEKDEELNQALFGRSILETSYQYYFEFKIQIADNDLHNKLSGMNIIYDLDEQEQKLKIYGRPTLRQLEGLCKLYIYVNNDELCIVEGGLENKEKDIDWKGLYSAGNEKYLKCKEPALYSGVVPRLKKVKFIKASDANTNISRIEVEVERTTFMTMLGMGRLYLNKHELLSSYEEVLQKFDNKEAEIQKKFFSEISSKKSSEDVVGLLNNYLNESKYTHNMNISGNITTADDYCIYTKRNKNATDPGNYYCSVNGGCEIYDKNVDFYTYSVDEDLPSIDITTVNEKFSFGGELTRETCAELGLTDISNNWRYYGLSIMGRNNNENNEYILSLHFNILGYKYVNNSLKTIRSLQKKSTEKFENESLYGYRIEISKNSFEKVKNSFFGICKILQQWKDVFLILAIMVQALFKNSFSSIELANFISVDNILNVILNLALFIILMISLIAKYKNRKFEKTININVKTLINKKEKRFMYYKKLIKKQSKKADPVFILLFNLLVLSYLDEQSIEVYD